jgi:hypothetical protein
MDRVTRLADLCHWCLGWSLGRRQRQAVLRSFLRFPSKALSRTQCGSGHTACGFVPLVSKSKPQSSSEAGNASVVSKTPLQGSQSYPVHRVTRSADL